MSPFQSLPGMSLPPPASAFRLLDGTGTIGWIDGNRVGFTGFSTISEAAAAAWVAQVALERRAAKSRREAAPYLEPGALQLVWSGNSEWIHSGATPLARLIRPAAREMDGENSWFGIDVVLPPANSDIETGSSAHVIYRALRRSGVRWPIRNRPAVVMDRPDDQYSEELIQAELTAGETQAHVVDRKGAMSEQPSYSNDDVENASLDSFPASDPPKWGSLRLGPPIHTDFAAEAAKKEDTAADRVPLEREGESDAASLGGP